MKDFKKYYDLPAPPEEVYMALTNPFTIELWTGEEAVMSTVPGSEFSLFEESIVGKNIAFEDGKMIRQQWYFGEQTEDSIVTIKLHPKTKSASTLGVSTLGTSVEVKHTNIPDEDYENIVQGWNTNIFAALYAFYAE